MTQYVEIVVNLPKVTNPFHYHLPLELEGQVKPGSLVVAQFGSQTIQGIVLGLIETPEVPETKPILELVDPQPVLTTNQLQLGRWLAENTLSTLTS